MASNDQSQISQANEPKNNPPVNKNPYPNTREDVKMPTGVSLAGKDFAGQFVKLNKYLIDDKKMTAYADKQFKKTDKDNSGTLELKEFKAFVTGIMTNKRLPPPSDRKVLALMKKYDKDSNGTLDPQEFKSMLEEIFCESREILVLKYADKKAASWKSTRAPAKKDTSKVEIDRKSVV